MFRSSLALALTVMLTSTAMASTLLVDRGLPTANLNNSAGANRSNVTWASGSPTGFTGDSFSIGVAGQSYRIDSLTVWGAQYNPLSLDINNIWLYLGKAGAALAMVSTGAVTGNVNSNPNISHTYVSYPGTLTSSYEGNGGTLYPIAQTTFSGLNYAVDGGATYDFGVNGDNFLWWNHASNAALSGTPQDGADNKYLEFTTTNLNSVVILDSNGNGWDKSSDINVRIEGAQIPEPATLALLGVALAGLGATRRRKQA